MYSKKVDSQNIPLSEKSKMKTMLSMSVFFLELIFVYGVR